jgi:putative membrane protein
MRYLRNFSTLIAAAILPVLSIGAQTTDPYNPQTRRNPAMTAVIDPSLADMGSGTDQGNIGPFVTMTDKQYAQGIAARGMLEIRLGQVALDKTKREDVKAVAQHMIKDYLSWNDGITKAARKLSIALPTELDGRQKGTLERISALSGDAFDQAYLKEVIHLQQKALTMSHLEANEASVTGFRHWAGITIPNIQDQIEMAQRALDAHNIISRK